MLRHASTDVKSPLLRDVPDDPRLLGGMFYVLGERWGWQEAVARTWVAQYAGTEAYEEARKHVGSAVASTVADHGNVDVVGDGDGLGDDLDDEDVN